MPESQFQVLNVLGYQALPDAQRIVFEELSPEELSVVSSIQERLNAAVPEVEGQGEGNNNCLC